MGDELESGDYDKDLADKEATKEDILAKKQDGARGRARTVRGDALPCGCLVT